jgi:predicted DNA-binding transcriptional regulator AlpA
MNETQTTGRVAGKTLLDTKAVASQLDIKPNTLAQWRISGDGPRFINVGRLVRYRQEDVDEWIGLNARMSTSDIRRH